METSTSPNEDPSNTDSIPNSIPRSEQPDRDDSSTAETETEGERRNRVRRENYAKRNNPRDTTSQDTPRTTLVIDLPDESTHPANARKKRGPKAKAPSSDPMTTMLVQSAIQGLFSLTATRAGAHWLITDEEAQSISEPTANILAKYLPTDKLNSYSDPVVLLIAVVSIILPRAITSIQAKKVKTNATRPTTIPTPPEQPKRTPNRNSEPTGEPDQLPTNRYTGDPAKADVDELLSLVNNSAY